MITTSMQLKAKIRNLSGGDNDRARVLIRTFIMERFLERVALSPYRDKFILKGGMLVASMVGLEARATMDIDTTMQAMPLTIENARSVIEDILRVDVQDGVSFTITKVKTAFGNEVPVYDRERAICDMIRCRKDTEVQTFRTAMREYMSSKKKNLGNLMRYAKRLGIEDNVRIYTEVML